jgi:hypothetical protein
MVSAPSAIINDIQKLEETVAAPQLEDRTPIDPSFPVEDA